jgi:gentisate 1,2-dioxygenase
MTCYLQLLQPGQQTRFHRHTGTAMYHTVQGRGVTMVDKNNQVDLQWDEHDSFTVPPWRWTRTKFPTGAGDPLLVTDRPLLEMTGWNGRKRVICENIEVYNDGKLERMNPDHQCSIPGNPFLPARRRSG